MQAKGIKAVEFLDQRYNLKVIAAKASLDPSYISRVLSGKRDPSLSTVRKICRAMGVSLDEFVAGLDLRAKSVAAPL